MKLVANTQNAPTSTYKYTQRDTGKGHPPLYPRTSAHMQHRYQWRLSILHCHNIYRQNATKEPTLWWIGASEKTPEPEHYPRRLELTRVRSHAHTCLQKTATHYTQCHQYMFFSRGHDTAWCTHGYDSLSHCGASPCKRGTSTPTKLSTQLARGATEDCTRGAHGNYNYEDPTPLARGAWSGLDHGQAHIARGAKICTQNPDFPNFSRAIPYYELTSMPTYPAGKEQQSMSSLPI